MNLAVKISSCLNRSICFAVSTLNIPVKINTILLSSLLRDKKSEFVNLDLYSFRLKLVDGLLEKSKQNGINTKESYVTSKVNSYADSFCQALQDFVDRYEYGEYKLAFNQFVKNKALDMLLMNGIGGPKYEIDVIVDFMIDYVNPKK